jgi:hypothetical protein
LEKCNADTLGDLDSGQFKTQTEKRAASYGGIYPFVQTGPILQTQ